LTFLLLLRTFLNTYFSCCSKNEQTISGESLPWFVFPLLTYYSYAPLLKTSPP